jgi:Tol biopolymer transport system component
MVPQGGDVSPPDDPDSPRLDSWKEIAAYLKRGITTVQRWERHERLPVHRHQHQKRGSVYAFKAEIDRWWQEGRHRLEDATAASSPAAAAASRSPAWAAWLGLCLAVLAAGAAGVRSHGCRSGHGVTTQLGLIEELQLGPGSAIAVSPDGRQLVYVAWRGGIDQLFVRAREELQGRRIRGTEHARAPFVSPDGRWVGFFVDGQLMKAPLQGGVPTTLATYSGTPLGAAWAPGGAIVFASLGTGLRQVSETGGPVRTLTMPNASIGEIDHRWPATSPDGRDVLFTIWSGAPDTSRLAVQSLMTGKQRALSRGTYPRWADGGHILFAWTDGLWAAPYDRQGLDMAGPSLRVVDSVRPRFGGATDYDVGRDGSLVYLPGAASEAQTRPVWVDAQGRATPIRIDAGIHASPRISPDGSRLALVTRSREGAFDVWVHDLARGTRRQITTEGASFNPLWEPGGTHVVYASGKAGRHGVYRVRSDGAGPVERLLTHDFGVFPQSWSPGAHLLAYHRVNASNGHDLWLLARDGTTSPYRATAFFETGAAFAPDGRSLAYASNESGRFEVYLEGFPATGRRRLVSTGGGREPMWAPDGKALFYRSLDGRAVLRVRVSAAGREDGPPSLLFESSYEGMVRTPGVASNYDVARDGRLLLLEKLVEAPRQIHVLTGWMDELKHWR